MSQDEHRSSASGTKPAHRAWSLYLLTVAGIPIYLNITFILLLGFIAFVQLRSGEKIFGGVLFVICVFISVVLHELGHALMARRFGIKTDDIVLWPIGGIARLRGTGEGFQEFWIAIAGPAVNLVIVFVIYFALHLTGHWVPFEKLIGLEDEILSQAYFWHRIMFVNIALMVFNMIPAFPMDGGRVLRALLGKTLGKARATAIAAKIGQVMAMLFVVLGLFGNPLLIFIGFFVYMAGGQEAAATRSAALMAGHTVRDAMITHFDTLSHGDSLGKAADLLLASSQQDFPVIGGQEVLGVLSRNQLIQGLATQGRDHYVAEVMERDFVRMQPDDELRKAHDLMHERDGVPVMVFDGERLVGYVNHENLMEYLLIAQTNQREK